MAYKPLFGEGSSTFKKAQDQAALLRRDAKPVGGVNQTPVNPPASQAVSPVSGTEFSGSDGLPQQPTVPVTNTQAPVQQYVPAPQQATPPPQVPTQTLPAVQQHVTATPQTTAQQQNLLQPSVPMQVQQPAASPETQDDRREKRKRTLKGGMIILPGRMMASFSCKIRNESRGGVMLALPDAMLIPAEFYLIRDADPGNKVPCRVAWRQHDKLGVQFVSALVSP